MLTAKGTGIKRAGQPVSLPQQTQQPGPRSSYPIGGRLPIGPENRSRVGLWTDKPFAKRQRGAYVGSGAGEDFPPAYA
jgi:hypothetical protein